MTEHFGYSALIDSIAEGGWGQQFSSREDAESALVRDPTKLAAFGIMQLVRRVNSILDAINENRDTYRRSRDVERVDEAKGTNAKPRPGAKIGDIRWDGNLSEGFYRSVVVAIDEDGCCQCATIKEPGEETEWMERVSYHLGDHATLAEAIQKDAEHDVRYHEPRLKYARKALAAVKSGSDLQEFIKGQDED